MDIGISNCDGDFLLVDAGVTQFFRRLDIGSLDMGDYLGTTYYLP